MGKYIKIAITMIAICCVAFATPTTYWATNDTDIAVIKSNNFMVITTTNSVVLTNYNFNSVGGFVAFKGMLGWTDNDTVVLTGQTNGVPLFTPVIVDIEDLLTFSVPTTNSSWRITPPGGTVLIDSNNYASIAVFTTNSVTYTNTTYNYSKFGDAAFTVQFMELNYDGSLKCLADDGSIVDVDLEDIISVTP